MLRRVVEDYLESIKEVQFFLPFSYLLLLKGFYDVHIIHGSYEFGKDIIAKKDESDGTIQYVFQLKAGDINLSVFRDEICPQLLEATINNLSHPNFDPKLKKKIFFVTTGILKPPATLSFQEFNNNIQNKFRIDPIQSIEKLDMVEDFVKLGLEPFFTLHDDPAFIGEFFSFYAKIKNNTDLDSFSIEIYTKRWIVEECEENINKLQVFLEAYLFSALLLNYRRYYQAALFIAGLARFLLKNNLYSKHEQVLIDYFNIIVTNVIEEVQTLYNNNQKLVNLHAKKGPLEIFRYPKKCLHTLELISLINLLSEKNDSKLNSIIKEIIGKERGWERPLSDNYAMSVALIGLSLMKNGEWNLLKKIINNITLWLCDRYENIGLSRLGSSEDEEFEQLLSEYLEGFDSKRISTSFLASVLLDLSFMTNDPEFYERIANDLRASSVILEYYHINIDENAYGYNGVSCSFDPRFKRKFETRYSKGIEIELEDNKMTLRSSADIPHPNQANVE